MLEERLSSAYSQQNLGYGIAQGIPQYPNMHGLPTQGSEAKAGAENFYYGNQPDTSQPPSSAYPPPHMHAGTYEHQPSAAPNPAYPPQAQYAPSTEQHHSWGQNPYPSLASPPPNGAITSPHAGTESVGAAQPYPPHLDPNATPISAETPPWQPSPIARRDSQYQPSAPPGPSAPDAHSPEHVQSSLYSTAPPGGAPAPQQPTGYPTQSYYYPPQSQASYPPMATGQPGPYPEAAQAHPPASHQPPRPVEESLIDL